MPFAVPECLPEWIYLIQYIVIRSGVVQTVNAGNEILYGYKCVYIMDQSTGISYIWSLSYVIDNAVGSDSVSHLEFRKISPYKEPKYWAT